MPPFKWQIKKDGRVEILRRIWRAWRKNLLPLSTFKPPTVHSLNWKISKRGSKRKSRQNASCRRRHILRDAKGQLWRHTEFAVPTFTPFFDDNFCGPRNDFLKIKTKINSGKEKSNFVARGTFFRKKIENKINFVKKRPNFVARGTFFKKIENKINSGKKKSNKKMKTWQLVKWKVQKIMRHRREMRLNTSQICVCNAVSCSLETEQRKKNMGVRRLPQRRSAAWNKSGNLKSRVKQACSLFWFFKNSVFKFLQFWLWVNSEIFMADFFKPYEIAVGFKKCHCFDFYFYRPRALIFHTHRVRG